MPTSKPRFLVTLEPRHHRALKLLAASRGVSVSSLINQMLAPALEPLLRLADLAVSRDQLDLEDYLAGLDTDLSSMLAKVSQSLDDKLRASGGGSREGVSPDAPQGGPEAAPAPGGGGAVLASKPRSKRAAPPPEGRSGPPDPRSVITGVTPSAKRMAKR